MTPIRRTLALSTISMVLCSGMAFSQDHQDDRDHQGNYQTQRDQHRDDRGDRDRGQDHQDHYVRHNDWRRGGRISHDDWNRGQQIDYRHHHLRRPPRGYEWREVDGNYVMAAVATGVIASVIAASAAH